MKKKSLLAALLLTAVFSASAYAIGEVVAPPYGGYAQPYGYGYARPYAGGISNDNPLVRSVDNHYDTRQPVQGYAGPPQGQGDYYDPYHAEMEHKARQLNLKKMDRALKNEDREDRADGRRETRDKMYTGRDGLETVDKTTNTIHNVHSLIRSFR